MLPRFILNALAIAGLLFAILIAGFIASFPANTIPAAKAKAPAPGPVLKITWDNLIPPGLTAEKLEKLMREKGSWSEEEGVFFQAEYFPVNKKLDGRRVQIAGYVVPLDMEADKVDEFLLVPYFGACIHVPPPPPNQVIYVKMSRAFRMKAIDVPVLVTGPLSAKIKKSDLANTGYMMFAERIEPYKPPKKSGKSKGKS